MARHARLGPSSSEIWLACESAPQAWRRYPPRIPGVAASEGTLAHTLCEAALMIHDIPWTAGQTFMVDGRPIEVTDEMLGAVSLYAATVLSIRDKAQWSCIEQEVDIGWLWGDEEPPEDVFGTADFAAVVTDTLDVCDFKFGRGKAVQPEFNPQLSIYGVGALGKLRRERPDLERKIKRVRLTIVQPRAGGKPVRQWELGLGELIAWAHMTLKPAIERIAYGEPGVFIAGSHCWFCPAGVDCETLRALKTKHAVEALPEFEEV